MSLPRICWRRSLRLRNPSTTFIRRNTQPAYTPLQEHPAAVGLSVPLLTTNEDIRQNGIRNPIDNPQRTTPLYTPNGLRIAWDDYQGSVIERVNELTAETPLYGKPVRPIALAAARDPLKAALFNNASMALNNHLYFNGISLEGPTEMPPKLATKLAEDFGSIEILRNEMLAMAYTMFGPGFVWLVRTELKGATMTNQQRKFRLMCTYLAGSPLAGAHNRAQPVDMNTQNVAAAEAAGGVDGLSEQERRRQTEVQNKVGAIGAHAADNRPLGDKTSFGGVHIVPVLCVNTWQHAWLPDHGVGGKMNFLQKWWDLINWNVVNEISDLNSDKPDGFSHNSSKSGGSLFYNS